MQLLSANSGKVTELARMDIVNDGTGKPDGVLRNYVAMVYRGRNTKALDNRTVQKGERISAWPSERVHVWNLVAAFLTKMGYGT